jgi:hypothetical protein
MAGAGKGSSNPGESRPGETGRRKRPGPPTIDLTATEVPPAEPKAAAADQPSSEQRAAEPPGSGAPPPSSGWQDIFREAVARHWPPPGPVVVGVIAIVLIVLGTWLVPSAQRSDPSDTLALRLALVEQQLRQLGERPAPTDARVPELAGRIGAAEQAMRRLDDISARLGTTEQALRRQEDAVAKLGSGDQASRRLEGLGARLDTVEQTLAAPRQPDRALAERVGAADAAVKTLTDRLGAIEATTKSMAEKADAAGATDKALSERLATLESASRALGERVAELGRRVDQVRAVANEADRQATIATEEAAQSRAEAPDRGMRVAFLTSALRAAVERGGAFAGELAALKPLMPAEQLAPLAPFAATGIPTAQTLARELSTLTPAMLAAVAPTTAGDGLLDRLQHSAERLVRIRPINEQPGDDPITVIGRIEAKAGRHDIDGALPEFAKLPEAARAPAAAWIRKAEARRAALDIAGRLAHDAFGALGKTTP